MKSKSNNWLKQHRNPHPYRADTTLLKLNKGFGFSERLRFNDACEHVIVLGATGSGKTSCVLSSLLKSALRGGASALTLSYKDSDGPDFERICHKAGVKPILLGPRHASRFPLFPYLFNGLKLPAREVAEVLVAGVEARNQNQRSQSDPIWVDAMKGLLADLITVLAAASEEISITKIQDLMSEVQDPKLVDLICSETNKEKHEEERIRNSILFRTLKNSKIEGDVRPAFKNLLDRFQKLPSDTGGSVVFNLNTLSDLLDREPLSYLLSSKPDPKRPVVTPTTLLREPCALVLDFPVAKFDTTARIFTTLLFAALRKAAGQRRRAKHEVLIFADEIQDLGILHEATKIIATGRSMGLGLFAASQSDSGLKHRLGEEGANALLAGGGTTIICRSDSQTAQGFEKRCGTITKRQRVHSFYDGGSSSYTMQEKEVSRLPAESLRNLKTPKKRRFGPFVINNFRTEAVVLKNNRIYRHIFYGEDRKSPSYLTVSLFLIAALFVLLMEPIDSQILHLPDIAFEK